MTITTAERSYSTLEAADAAGVTYRQLDYWLRRGIVRIADDPQPGSGSRRQFTGDEVERLIELVSIYEGARTILRQMSAGVLWESSR